MLQFRHPLQEHGQHAIAPQLAGRPDMIRDSRRHARCHLFPATEAALTAGALGQGQLFPRNT